MSETSSSATSSAPRKRAKNTAGFDVGQFVSRQFNFIYVVGSVAFLIFWPWFASPLDAWERIIWVVAALLGEVAFVQGIKHLCYIPRPHAKTSFAWGRRPHSGMPSGHTVPAFLLATFVAASHPVWGAIWYGGATLIAWARWRTQAHYAYQVVVSALLGIVLALIVMRWR